MRSMRMRTKRLGVCACVARFSLHAHAHHAVGCMHMRTTQSGVCALEMDRMSKFAYPRMRIRMRIPAREAPRMRIPVRYPRMRIFVEYLNNTSYCQMGAAFVTEYRLLHYNDYTEYQLLTAECRGL